MGLLWVYQERLGGQGRRQDQRGADWYLHGVMACNTVKLPGPAKKCGPRYLATETLVAWPVLRLLRLLAVHPE